MNKSDIAYLAGLFDGEGCVTIVHHHKRHSARLPMRHELFVNIASTHEPVLLWVKKVLGFGFVRKKRCAGYPGMRKDIWYWEAENCGAEDFIRIVQPFLKIKSAHAAEALAFRERQQRGVVVFNDCLKMKRLNGRREACRIGAA